MERGRSDLPLRYRRARSLLYVIGLFWLWVGLGGGVALLHGLHHSPLYAAVAVYAIAVAVLVSLPTALLAAIQMILTRPVRRTGITEQPSAVAREADSHWWFDSKAS
jgi:hypothetical protein